MRNLINMLKNESGQGLVEYAIILSIVSIVAVVALKALSAKITSTLNNASAAL